MKSVILVLATVLFCSVITADGIKCEYSAHSVSEETGEVNEYFITEKDCPESASCVLVTYTYSPGYYYDYGGGHIFYEGACGKDDYYASQDLCNDEYFGTCSQKFCSEDLCNAFSRNYPPKSESLTTEQPTTEPTTTKPPTTKSSTTEPPTTEPPTTESPTTEPPTTESPTTEPPTTEPPTTVVETSTSTSPSSNCPFLNEAQTVDFNCSRFYDDLSKCGRRRAWSCDYSSWRLNMLDVFLKEVVDKIPEDSDFKLPKCGNDDGISCESSEKCCYTSYSGCQVCHCIDHDYKDQTYLQNIWKKDHRLWRKLNKFYIDFFSEESQYFDTC